MIRPISPPPIQNASDRVSACASGGSSGSSGSNLGTGMGLEAGGGVAEEEAAWSALLQHNESLAAVTEAQPEPGPALGSATTTSRAPSTSAESVGSGDGGTLVLVDSNGLQRPPPREPAVGQVPLEGAANYGQGHGQDHGQEHGQDSHGGNGLHREQRREAAERAEHQLHSTDSSQDGVTDLSSVDEDDYTETDDDETDLLD